MKQYVNAANLITSGTLAAGFAAVLLAADGRLRAATVAVGVAAVLDAVDGAVARRSSASQRFGGNLDSLADLVAFGVAPALMLYQAVLQAVPVAGTAACVAFVLAGAWRLARFPLVEDRRRFVGLPIPPAGVVVAVSAAVALPGALALPLTLALAVLMVSSIPFPTLVTVGRVARPHRPDAADAAAVEAPRGAHRPSRRQRLVSRAQRGRRWPAIAGRRGRRRTRP